MAKKDSSDGEKMFFSRRRFIQTSAIMLCSGLLVRPSLARTRQCQLPIPPLLFSDRGQPFFLTLQQAKWSFNKLKKTNVWGINGQYLAPTIRVKQGQDAKLIYTNRLNDSVSMTISGLQAPGSLMGGAARVMQPNTSWSPIIPISQPAATCWYHANTPHKMGPQVYNGLVGMWIVEEEGSQQRSLPHHYGVDDFPLILQDKRFNSSGVMEYSAAESEGFLGSILVVNGAENPCIDVARGWVRLRLLNASNARRYVLQLNTGQPMYLIANDLGLLNTPITVQKLPIAPGERREVLIDMSAGKETVLTVGVESGILDNLRQIFDDATLLITHNVLTLRSTGLMSFGTMALPKELAIPPQVPVKPNFIRTLRLGGKIPGINGSTWDRERIDFQVKQNHWERWHIVADVPQSFHIQGVSFLIRNVNGQAVSAVDQGWKDTVWIDGEVELDVYFSQVAEQNFPFLYYSQTLELADKGSMGQFTVQAAASDPFHLS